MWVRGKEARENRQNQPKPAKTNKTNKNQQNKQQKNPTTTKTRNRDHNHSQKHKHKRNHNHNHTPQPTNHKKATGLSEGLIFWELFGRLWNTQGSASETGGTPGVGAWHPISSQLAETADQSQSS